MAATATFEAKQGVAYVVGAHGVLLAESARTKCPVSQLQTLLALYTLNEAACLPASPGQLCQVMHLSPPLLRGYVRALEARGYLVRERFFRRGQRLLKLTPAGQQEAEHCQRALRRAAERVLEWQLHQ